jgi:hypothetical protein
MESDDPNKLKESLKQSLIWEIGNNAASKTEDPTLLLSRRIAQDMAKGLDLPLFSKGPDIADRLELLLGKRLGSGDYDLLNRVREAKLAPSSGKYNNCAMLQITHDGYQVYYNGESKSYEYLSEAAGALKHASPAPSHVIFDSDITAYLPDEAAVVLKDHDFNYVVDREFFLLHGIPSKPKHVIVLASVNRTDNAELNRVIFGGEKVAQRRLDALNKQLGDTGRFAPTRETLLAALKEAQDDNVLPWIVGHNEEGNYILGDGTPISIEDLAPYAVNFSCNLNLHSTDQLGARTIVPLDTYSLFKALGKTYHDSASEDSFAALWANYRAERKLAGQKVAAGSGLLITATGVYAFNAATQTNQSSTKSPHSSKRRSGRSHSAKVTAIGTVTQDER